LARVTMLAHTTTARATHTHCMLSFRRIIVYHGGVADSLSLNRCVVIIVQPFRKVRLFFLYSFAASGSVGFLIAALRFIALTQGIDQGQVRDCVTSPLLAAACVL
jgi:Low psii accumulation1 / Rep27